MDTKSYWVCMYLKVKGKLSVIGSDRPAKRGVNDVLIACIDNLAGFPQAINAVFPQTEIQTCIVHQIRNSLKCVASKDQTAFMKDLKPVYQVEMLELAELRLDQFTNGSLTIQPLAIQMRTIFLKFFKYFTVELLAHFLTERR